jgi:hypothetical protein
LPGIGNPAFFIEATSRVVPWSYLTLETQVLSGIYGGDTSKEVSMNTHSVRIRCRFVIWMALTILISSFMPVAILAQSSSAAQPGQNLTITVL